jgi:hypothetical protein
MKFYIIICLLILTGCQTRGTGIYLETNKNYTLQSNKPIECIIRPHHVTIPEYSTCLPIIDIDEHNKIYYAETILDGTRKKIECKI